MTAETLPDEKDEGSAGTAGTTIVGRRFELNRGYTTLEAWQLRDVAIDKRVTPEDLVLYHVLQSFALGRRGAPVWPGNPRIAVTLGVKERQIQRRLASLEQAGWIVRTFDRSANGTQRTIICPIARFDKEEVFPGQPGCPQKTPLGGSPEDTQNYTHPEQPSEPPYPPTGGDSETPSKPKRKTKPRPLRKGDPFVIALASELLEVYPHGVRDSGELRKPPRAVVVDRLVGAFCPGGNPLPQPEIEALAGEMTRVAKLLRDVPRSLSDRRYTKGLEVWLRQEGWTNPPVVGPKPPPERDGRRGDDSPRGFAGVTPEELRARRLAVQEARAAGKDLDESPAPGLSVKEQVAAERARLKAWSTRGAALGREDPPATPEPNGPVGTQPRGPQGPSTARVGDVVGQLRDAVVSPGEDASG